LVTTISRRRSQRSARTPVSEPSTICGTNEANIIAPDASVDPVSWYT
jgi:hypothetical protein